VIAKLVAEAGANEDLQLQNDVLNASNRLMQYFGFATMLFLIGFANLISNALGYPESAYSFYVLGIASYFVALNAAYRGFFQGTQRLEFYGVSQLLEQIGRVVFGLALVVVLAGLSMGDDFIAAAGTSGALFGAVISWGYVVSRHKKHYKNHTKTKGDFKPIYRSILKLMLPIALGASIMPLLSIIDGTLVVWRLRDIGLVDTAAILYSYISFYSSPIINISQVVFTAIQVSLLPMITKSFTQKSHSIGNQIDLGILLSLVMGLPIGLGIAGFAKEILLFLYPSKAAIAVDAAPVLAILGVSIVFLSVYLATTSILQGMNQYKKPVVHLFVGAGVKVVAAYVLIGIPSINIDGAAYSTLMAYAVAAFLNIRLVYQLTKPTKKTLMKMGLTLMANAAMIVSAKLVFALLESSLAMRLNLLISIFIAVVVYAAFIYFGKIVTKADFDGLDK
jgi:stage V sporulation protein B